MLKTVKLNLRFLFLYRCGFNNCEFNKCNIVFKYFWKAPIILLYDGDIIP